LRGGENERFQFAVYCSKGKKTGILEKYDEEKVFGCMSSKKENAKN